ncbi:MAG: ABC transporter permease, partial [Pseudomonadota bacterium]|nr:ABC transporter permease [Pseudomonadota bacterium]
MTRAFNRLEWQFAGRYLRARRRESFISIIAIISFLGIMLGVATLIVVMAVMNGFRADLLDRILGVSGHVVARPWNGQFEDRAATVARLQKLPPVVLATPLVDGQAMMSSGQAVRGVVLRGMSTDALKRLPALAGNVRAGALDDLSQSGRVAIGLRLAERYGIGVGDPVTLIAPRGLVTPFGTTPRIKQFRVAAIFSIGLSEYDLNIMFSGLETAQGFFSESAQSGAIELILDDPDKVEAYRGNLQNTAGLDVSLVDWKQSNRTLAGALEVERNVMFLILTLILLVAALNIVSGLIMLVRDKHRDIAVLRSMGASRGMVLRVFFITGASIGVIGSLAGFGLGVVFCVYIEEIRQLLVMIT